MSIRTAPAPARSGALLPAETQVGTVTIRVADAERSLAFYRDMIGLHVIERTRTRIALGAGGRAFLFLEVRPDTTPRPDETTGLYHFAILVPDRPSLGGVLARIMASRIRLGASDHLVSEALYIWDPDNNGVEVYRDRPREQWVWEQGAVRMATLPMDRQSVLSEGLAAGTEREPLPVDTRMGHVHLQVGDLAEAKHFYGDLFGFEQTSGRGGAIFLSAGGYHHHLGCNIWHSDGRPRPPKDAAGLEEFTVELPDADSVAAARVRFEGAGVSTEPASSGFRVRDPWGIAMRVLLADAISTRV
jgi:catechol 2,3-dioxygenase